MTATVTQTVRRTFATIVAQTEEVASLEVWATKPAHPASTKPMEGHLRQASSVRLSGPWRCM